MNMKKKFAVLLAVVMAVSLFSACNKKEEPPPVVEKTDTKKKNSNEQPDKKERREREDSRLPATPEIINLNFAPGFNIVVEEYSPLVVEANVPEYSVNPDLSNIENLDQFPDLTPEQRGIIAKNGFVVVPSDYEQLFYIYETNAYGNLPSFVTADSVLQLFHIFYDYSLRMLETDFLYDSLVELNENMLYQLIEEYNYAADERVKQNILEMIGYFGVANLALDSGLPDEYPVEIADKTSEEFSLISKAEGISRSPLFNINIDYSMFTIRGHYTRSELLGKYFKAMSWYGVVPMPFFKDGNRDEEAAARAIITSIALCHLPEEDGGWLWENIYSPTSYYVGESDDLSPFDIAEIVTKVYSDSPDINKIYEGMDDFYEELEKAAKPLISQAAEGMPQGVQMRFMGQRYIPDSEILQNLSTAILRPVPAGADIFAVFGSERAEEIINEIYKPAEKWREYPDEFDKMRYKFDNQTIAEQTGNIYAGWLYTLKSLTTRPGIGYPMFMQNTAWEDKSLSSALGSWAEIRHDTILYGKQSAAEMGGGEEPPDVVSYVEPNPEFFNRLLWLITSTKENLSARGLLANGMEYKLESFEEMLIFLKDCAIKELLGGDLTRDDKLTLLKYGGTLERLSSSIAEADSWYLVESDTDKNMALIADVHTLTDVEVYLEAALGTAAEIYVAVPQNGKIYLTRGAVFDYFEFLSKERLTDEKWQSKIKEGYPNRPPFTASYMDESSAGKIENPDEPYSIQLFE